MTSTTAPAPVPFNGHTEEIRAISAEIYHQVGALRHVAGLPILLDVVRAENVEIKTELDAAKRENEALRQALAILRQVPSLAPAVSAVPIATMPAPTMAAFKGAEPVSIPPPVLTPGAPSSAPSTPKKGGRPTNHALIAFLKAGHFEGKSNKAIGRMFGVAANTIRRHLWELGLKREKPVRRRGRPRTRS